MGEWTIRDQLKRINLVSKGKHGEKENLEEEGEYSNENTMPSKGASLVPIRQIKCVVQAMNAPSTKHIVKGFSKWQKHLY